MISQLLSLTKSKNIVARSSLQLGLLLLLAIVLSACSNNPSIPDQVQITAEAEQPNVATPPSSEELTRHDAQGAVEVSVTPLNIQVENTDSFNFEISMNTHSVDLSMDLAASSTLETDLGELILPLSWSGGTGHHVQGILVFPTKTSTGSDFLKGASNLTLIIRDVDAPAREFVWEFNGSQ